MAVTCDGMRFTDELMRCMSSDYGIGAEPIPPGDANRSTVDAIKAGIARLDGDARTTTCDEVGQFMSRIVQYDLRDTGDPHHRTFVNEARTTAAINARFGLQVPRISRNEVWHAVRELARGRQR